MKRRTVDILGFIGLTLSCTGPARAGVPSEGPGGDKAPAAAVENSVGMKLVRIPAGEFVMGNPEPPDSLAKAFPAYEAGRVRDLTDDPPHKVRITKPFYMGACEVTVGQFGRFLDDAEYVTEPERDGTGGWGYDPETQGIEGRDPRYSWRNPGFVQGGDHPVVNITWYDSMKFCEWLGKKEGKTYRLPTEAEWEYACRAGTTTRYNFGDDPEWSSRAANTFDRSCRPLFEAWSRYALRGDDNYPFTAPVGRFPPNAFGLHDMHGNVWEWCSDFYDENYYKASPVEDPKGPEKGGKHSRRGGAWHSFALYTRSCYRNFNTPRSRYPNLGLRVVMEENERGRE